MATPYTKLTEAQIVTLQSTTLGNLKPYQIRQIHEALERKNYKRGPMSDVSVEQTIATIFTSSGNNP